MPGAYAPFGLEQSPHAGFPTAVRLADGTVRMMWRQGAGHVSGDGRIYTSVGNPATGEWSTPELVRVDGGPDIRDPHLGPSGLSEAGGDVWLTYFVTNPATGIPTGARAARSTDGGQTFGPSVRIDPNLPYAAISAPIVQVGTKLWTAFYGRKAGEAVDTAWVAWSADGGTTWTSNRLANAIGGGLPYQEPWLVANGNKIVVLFRAGNWSGIGMRSSPDAGATWGPVTRVLDNATGNSASVWASNGTIYTVYRHTVTRDAMLATSTDGGQTWTSQRTIMPRPAGSAAASVGMTYAHPVELGTGYIWCPIGMERAPTDSRLYLGYL
ncbi:exo-alpha-sialidase [Actinophytocola sediminis]